MYKTYCLMLLIHFFYIIPMEQNLEIIIEEQKITIEKQKAIIERQKKAISESKKNWKSEIDESKKKLKEALRLSKKNIDTKELIFFAINFFKTNNVFSNKISLIEDTYASKEDFCNANLRKLSNDLSKILFNTSCKNSVLLLDNIHKEIVFTQEKQLENKFPEKILDYQCVNQEQSPPYSYSFTNKIEIDSNEKNPLINQYTNYPNPYNYDEYDENIFIEETESQFHNYQLPDNSIQIQLRIPNKNTEFNKPIIIQRNITPANPHPIIVYESINDNNKRKIQLPEAPLTQKKRRTNQ